MLTFCQNSFAEQKIVVLDLKYVLNNSKAGKQAQEYLKKSFNDNQKKFADIEKSLKKEEAQLLEKKASMTQDEYIKSAEKLRKKVIKYQSTRRGALDKIATQRAEAKDKLLKKIDPIINDYIKNNNVSLVMDKINMLGGTSDLDITNDIVKILDKELPSLNLK